MLETHSLESLNDHALLSRFGDLVRLDHEGNANLLRAIDLIDRRKLWAKLGHPSLFAFLVTRHHMSESTAGKRIGAARTARRFPVLFTMVASGEIHLSGIHRLKAHLTPENHEQVLARAKHKTIRQVEELVAHLAPKPDVPFTLRRLPNRPASPAAPTTAAPELTTAAPEPTSLAPELTTAALEPATAAPELTAGPPRRSPDPVPLAPDRFKLQVTIGAETRAKLQQLEDLLAHQIPNGDPALIIERAFDALLTEVLKSKAGATQKPRSARRGTSTPARRVRTVPAAVRRVVWKRDQGRCTFVGADGHPCNETRCVEFAHLEPWAKGGETTARNVALRCVAHNALEADRDYGTSFMAGKRERKPLKVRQPVARYVVRKQAFARREATSQSGRPAHGVLASSDPK